MPINIQITGETAQQVAAELAHLASIFGAPRYATPAEATLRVGTTPVAPAPAKETPKGEAERAEKKPSAQPATGGETSSSAAPAAEQASADKPVAASGEKFEYDTLKKAVHKLAGVNPEACVAINKSFEVKTMKDLPEDKWPAAYQAVTAKLAELGVK